MTIQSGLLRTHSRVSQGSSLSFSGQLGKGQRGFLYMISPLAGSPLLEKSILGIFSFTGDLACDPLPRTVKITDVPNLSVHGSSKRDDQNGYGECDGAERHRCVKQSVKHVSSSSPRWRP